jgi:hypothetical protein
MLNFPVTWKAALFLFPLIFMLMLAPSAFAQEQQCNSYITGQAINASGDSINGNNLSANVRDQYGDHTNWQDNSFIKNDSGWFNVSGLCYGKYYSIMFQNELNDPNRTVNWSVLQALNQDIGILNISITFASINGYVWTNETSKANITAGFLEFYNLNNELLWIAGVCGTQEGNCGGDVGTTGES